MKRSNPLRYLYWPFLITRSRVISRLLLPHIRANETVLDVGMGNGLIAQNLARTRNVRVHGLDVLDMNLTTLPQSIFDGQRIPFADNSFDNSLLIGVLHHVNEQEKLLNEVARVTGREIIIFEDVFRSSVGAQWVKLRDVIGNLPEELRMNFALNFRTQEGWEDLFGELDLELRYKNTMFNPIRLTRHALFVLKPRRPQW